MSYLCEAQQKQKFQHLRPVMFLVPAGEMCDAASKKMTSGKQLRLKFDFFSTSFRSASLPTFSSETIGPLLFQQNAEQPDGSNSSPRGLFFSSGLSEQEEETHLC